MICKFKAGDMVRLKYGVIVTTSGPSQYTVVNFDGRKNYISPLLYECISGNSSGLRVEETAYNTVALKSPRGIEWIGEWALEHVREADDCTASGDISSLLGY